MAAERLSVFPAFHKVAGRPVLIVGDGAEALAKVRLLSETEASIRLVAASASRDLAEAARRLDLEIRPRPFRLDDLEGVVLAFAASGERTRDAEVVAAARARNIPVNAVDLPDLCDFYTPAIVNRAPVAVAISSTGAGPVLAQKVRARIEAFLPPQLGALARLGETFRGAAEQMLPKGQPRRRFWSAFFDGGIADAALAGRTDEARRLASRLLSEADGDERGFVSLVGAGPGEADLLTLRAQRVLGEADVVVYDSDIPEAIVASGRRDAERIVVVSTDDVAQLLVREARAGRRVVRLVSGAGPSAAADEAGLRAAGILFEIIPGISSERSAGADLAIPRFRAA
jgi:uroporphyrin-III C-methyltransferase/precorrin-2 dehydrogenase/sirohydrochlorin ferrochelatase